MSQILDTRMPRSMRNEAVGALRSVAPSIGNYVLLDSLEPLPCYEPLATCQDWFTETVKEQFYPDGIVEFEFAVQRYEPSRYGIDYDVHLDDSAALRKVYKNDMILSALSTAAFGRRKAGVIVFDPNEDLLALDPGKVLDVRRAKSKYPYSQARDGGLMQFSPATEHHAAADLRPGDVRLRMRARPKKPPLTSQGGDLVT